jgi:hypothetical protein
MRTDVSEERILSIFKVENLPIKKPARVSLSPVEPTQLGPIRVAQSIGHNWIDPAEDIDRIQSPERCILNKRQDDAKSPEC